MTASARKSTGPPASEGKTAKKRWTVHVNEPAQNVDAANDTSETKAPHLGVADLELAALYPTPLPWRAELERHFDTSLAGLAAYQGPEVEAALAADDAQAAVQGDAVLLSRGAKKPLVAHEVAHILQQRAPSVAPDPQRAEVEAILAEQSVAEGNLVPLPQASLAQGAVALRNTDVLNEQALVEGSDREASREFQNAVREEEPSGEQDTAELTEEDTSQDTQSTGESVLSEVDAGEPLPEDPVPTFELPPMPEVEVDEAAAEATQAEAEAALEGADEADGLMGAFKDAPPSVKALHHDQLNAEVGGMAQTDQAEFENAMPEFPAEMSGEDDIAEPEPVATPEAREAQLEEGTIAPPPEPEVDPTPDPGTPDLNTEIRDLLSSLFSFGDASSLGQTFNRVSTSDNDVETSAGARPDVPLEGETDPQRVEDQDNAARDDALESRSEATQAVTEGPGPEQVELAELREDFTMEAREKPTIDDAGGPVAGAEGFRDKELDGEVVALFDAHHNEAMAASMEEASTEVSTAVESRDTERDAELSHAEEERARLNEEADEGQRAEVSTQRQEVQDARQHTVDEQQARLDDMETQADLDRQTAENTIDTEVSEAETQVEADFGQAEEDAQSEVDDGEQQAQEERDRNERQSENQSWWDRATDWVASQFDKLTKFINDVFDAVRSAVKDIIDAVKEAAIALIDAAVSAITSAIEALGEALKAAVNALLAEHFPALAEALNEAIDSAVEVATEVVEAIGEGLKAAVSALLDALAAAIDAILAAYQAAVNAALAIARAALTGDWDALARLILEPVLYALGIEPAAFYQMIERAMEALDIIIDDPIGFLSNLVESVVGGIRQFGSNIVTHLQAGIIGWLTGALGGDIQLPERFDLMGVLDLARQILGLTVDMIRRVAVRVLGEEAVERIEIVMGYVVELVTGGFSALWERIMSDLTNLKDMVLDGIKSFLMERIVMAAITWLASMFNPVGALIKLVMTIWNFIMFLKDQLARIIQVVQTVVSTMWEIATGVLQPAIDGVEGVLGRLLPIVIDLLARLLGLGNVAGKVREIIGRVRQRIEDALVRLINRVLSAFTGGRSSGTEADANATPGEDGEIMTPIRLQGGGESHTLKIKDEGETVVPMIHSTPQRLLDWLDERPKAPFDKLADERRWHGVVRTNKKNQLTNLVANAKTEEQELDAAAEKTEDALKSNPATAGDKQQDTQKEGEQTKRALEEVLEFFGIDPNASLTDHFREDIEKIDDASLAFRLKTNVLSKLDKPRYLILSWAEAVAQIPSDRALPSTWREPAKSTGLLRTLMEASFPPEVKKIADAHQGNDANTGLSENKLKTLIGTHLAPELHKPADVQDIVSRVLREEDGATIARSRKTKIEAAVDKMSEGATSYDHAFEKVTGSYYKNTLVPNIATLVQGSSFGKYLEDDAENDAGGGDGGVDKSLAFFVTDGQSKRAAQNRTRLANSVRGANLGQHEWIPSSTGGQLIQEAADQFGSTGQTRVLTHLAHLFHFQHNVRTPTSDLIFKPDADLNQMNRKVPYYSKSHADSKTAYADLSETQKTQFYPTSGPERGESIPVLQAHAGGLDAGKVASGALVRGKKLQWASPSWHEGLRTEIAPHLMDFSAQNTKGRLIKKAIIDYYDKTIWRGSAQVDTHKNTRFQLYFRSSHNDWNTYDELQADADSIYTTARKNMTTDMGKTFK